MGSGDPGRSKSCDPLTPEVLFNKETEVSFYVIIKLVFKMIIMFFVRTNIRREEREVVNYQGIFKKRLSWLEAVALMVSTTIGAGILGLPYAVSKVGIALGLVYIVCLGCLMMGLNLLLGEVAAGTKTNLQVVGLAKKYLGRTGGAIMTTLVYIMGFGSMVVYLVGEGQTLAELFGGDSFVWSLGFCLVISLLLFRGVQSVRLVDFVLCLAVLAVVFVISLVSAPHVSLYNFNHVDLAYLFFPYGIVLFAFLGSSSIPEAHSVLLGKDRDFKKAIITAGLIVLTVYVLFALVVVGVTGKGTSEIATIALGEKVGPMMYLFSNLFAFLAMGTSFLMTGLALRDSISWDYKVPQKFATLLVIVLPVTLFVLGLRGFISLIDVIGGVFASLELLLILLIYWRAKTLKHLPSSRYGLDHGMLIMAVLLAVLTGGAIYSFLKLF